MECFMEDYGDWIWDESEYNFFMSLTDVDKLEYVFDFFNLTEEDFEEFEFDVDPDIEDVPVGVPVDIVITNGHLVISCSNDEIMDKTIKMLRTDGMILLLQEKRNGSRVYTFVGTGSPISLN